ncbi:hypothetical protein NUW58_g5698 [Xylaria curta]|uniref:Uncharacterized protein n=1 Tax=Xylaria curta TaxID=42375 RepID=A0ACC1P0I3_9PEZI|nr:hypothetical protein NUW58_g5698 [Xylaria curta]
MGKRWRAISSSRNGSHSWRRSASLYPFTNEVEREGEKDRKVCRGRTAISRIPAGETAVSNAAINTRPAMVFDNSGHTNAVTWDTGACRYYAVVALEQWIRKAANEGTQDPKKDGHTLALDIATTVVFRPTLSNTWQLRRLDSVQQVVVMPVRRRPFSRYENLHGIVQGLSAGGSTNNQASIWRCDFWVGE